MTQTNVTKFADELGLLPTVLLAQLKAAGVEKQLITDNLTEQDKTQLLDHLRQVRGFKEGAGGITLIRRQTSEIRKPDGTGKPRTIQIEVRKKRTVVKVDIAKDTVVEKIITQPELSPSLTSAPASLIKVEQQILRQAEAEKQAELIARQTAEAQEKTTSKNSNNLY